MMRQMRENTKVILWVVVIAFVVTIFAVWGLDLRTGNTASDPNVIGKINGVPVTRSQYQLVYQQFAQQYRASSQNQPLTFSQEEFLRSQAWDNVVYNVLTTQEIKRLGITVTDDEVVFFLRNSPPVEVRQYFLDDEGNFDNQAYQTALNNPEIDWTNLEALARERIPLQKLNEYLAAQVHVSEADIRRQYESEAIKLTITYAEFPFDDAALADYTPSDEEITQYYESHTDEFKEGEKRRIELLTIPLEPSAADVDDARYTAGRIYERIRGGDDFATQAKTFSEAPTAFANGNTGFIRRGQREDVYFDAVEKMEEGEVSGPIPAEDGFYIVKLLEKRATDDDGTEFNVQEILIRPALSRQTSDSLFSVASEIRTRAAEIGLGEAAAEKGMSLLKPEPFTENAPIGDLGFIPAVSRYAFSDNPPPISPELRDDKNLYIARVLERIPEGTQELDAVRDAIREDILYEKKKTISEQSARAFFHKAKSTTLDEAVATYNVKTTTVDTFRVVDNTSPFGPHSAVGEAALTISPGEISPPIEWRDAWIVFYLRERSELDEEDYRAKIPEIKARLRNQKIQQYIAYWYDELRSKSTIEDYRENT